MKNNRNNSGFYLKGDKIIPKIEKIVEKCKTNSDSIDLKDIPFTLSKYFQKDKFYIYSYQFPNNINWELKNKGNPIFELSTLKSNPDKVTITLKNSSNNLFKITVNNTFNIKIQDKCLFIEEKITKRTTTIIKRYLIVPKNKIIEWNK